MASHHGGGMQMQTMRIPLNKKASHPAKNMTAPFQVGGILILMQRLQYNDLHHLLIRIMLACNTVWQCADRHFSELVNVYMSLCLPAMCVK